MTAMITDKRRATPDSGWNLGAAQGVQTMGIFEWMKGKQAALPEDAMADAGLAFEMWDSGWDGWITSEPALSVPAQAEAAPHVNPVQAA